uniref:Uncharacterized protein n=1 Tax=Cannabis sativa TaxID=3483 RepID=A0A803NHA5_CANSA
MIDTTPNLMTPIAAYLNTREILNNQKEAQKMMRKTSRYIIVEGVMYRRGFSMPLLRCVIKEEVAQLLSKVHEGFCGNHAGRKSLSKKNTKAMIFLANYAGRFKGPCKEV